MERLAGGGNALNNHWQSRLNKWATENNISNTSFLRIADNRHKWRAMTADDCNRLET